MRGESRGSVRTKLWQNNLRSKCHVMKSMEIKSMSSDFDIGQFLTSYDTLKGQVHDLNEILQATNVLRR